MKLLLDTHVFLWYVIADPKLPFAFQTAIQDPANEVYLSAASVWEAVIKHALGNSRFPALPRATCRSCARFTESPACRWTRGP